MYIGSICMPIVAVVPTSSSSSSSGGWHPDTGVSVGHPLYLFVELGGKRLRNSVG